MNRSKAEFPKAIHPQFGEITAPFIISASRATDIPAFYSDWLINRFDQGYVSKINPYDRSKISYISLKNVKSIVFWSKNPEPLIDKLSYFDSRKIAYYFQFTLNDYEKENLEPGLPKLIERIETFQRLSEKIGKEKVIWRFDPLIKTDITSYDDLLERIKKIADKIHPFTDKLVFSFAEIESYRKVRRAFNSRKDLFYKPPEDYQAAEDDKISFVKRLSAAIPELKKLNPYFQIASCADSIDYSIYGILPNRCIDDELLLKISDDAELHQFLRPSLFRDEYYLKDRGQRKNCGCILSRDIGAYDSCPHFCLYCYANYSKEAVLDKIKSFNKMSEFI
jgi:DNA repair photolyase